MLVRKVPPQESNDDENNGAENGIVAPPVRVSRAAFDFFHASVDGLVGKVADFFVPGAVQSGG
ncbi:MAG: hypothetical protein P8X53_11675 [Chromatiales bacterium]